MPSTGRVGRPIWFDAGMERALIAHSEIEQGIRYGLEHGQFIPFFEPQVDLRPARSSASRCWRAGIIRSSGIIGPTVHPDRRGHRR